MAANFEHQEGMRLLISSTDLDDLARVVKQLVWARIPCAVCKDPISSHLNVWIQQDIDFPLALRVSVNREAPRRLPHWARVYDAAVPAPRPSVLPAADRNTPLSGWLVQSKAPTWTETAHATALRYLSQRPPPARLAFWPFPGADRVSDPTVDDAELACAEAT